MSSVLYQLSVAHARCPRWASCLTCLTNCCNNTLLVATLLVSGLFCSLVCLALSDTDAILQALLTLLIGRLYSYALWFPLWLVLPCVGYVHCWWMERRKKRRQE